MTGASLFTEVPSPDDERLSRIQKNVKDAFDAVAAAMANLAFPILAATGSMTIPAGKPIVVFKGNTAGVPLLMLPLVTAQGPGTTAVIIIVNNASGNITYKASGTNTILNVVAARVLQTQTLVHLVSDGISNWVRQ